MCLCGHLGEQFLFAGHDFSSVFPGLMSWHCYDQIFQCSSSFLLGWMQWKSECFFFFFFFPVRSCLFVSSCQVETPNNPPSFHAYCPPMCWQPTSAFCSSDPSLVYSSLSYFFQGLWGFSCPSKWNKKACWKHWKRGLEERNERRWVGVGKRDRTSTAVESEQTTYLFSLKR